MLVLFMGMAVSTLSYGQPNAWINEIHYDNDGSDVGEAIEVIVKSPGSWDLSLLKVELYNGSNGTVYNTTTVNSYTVGGSSGDYTIYSEEFSSIQNGSPDGVALSYDGTIIQFLSYEGSFNATNGTASGVESTDILVSEGGSTAEGNSLQLSGNGASYGDFSWQSPATSTFGSLNNSQTLKSSSDVAPPVFVAGYPNSSVILDNKFNLNVKMDEPGKVYFSVLADGATAPDIATIKADMSLTVSDINIDTTVIIKNLSAETSYDVYVVAEDDEGTPNVQGAPVKIDVTTGAQRSISLIQPSNGDAVILGDTLWVKSQTTNIDSFLVWFYFETFGVYVDYDTVYSIEKDSVAMFINERFSLFDDLKMYIADKNDPSLTSDTVVVSLVDTIPPKIEKLTPKNNTEMFGSHTFSILFNERIKLGTNDSIIIYKKADGSVFDVIDVEKDSVWLEVDEILGIPYGVNFIPTKSLEPSTSYYIHISKGAIMDKAGNEFGVLDNTTWNFQTRGNDLFFSEYIEGSSNNKALEIYNPTENEVDLAQYAILTNSAGASWSEPYPMEGTLASKDIFVIINPDFDFEQIDSANVVDTVWGSPATYYNGDDGRALVRLISGDWKTGDWEIIDQIGDDAGDPGSGWTVAGIGDATKEHTLHRKATVQTGNLDWQRSAGTNEDNSEWKVYGQNVFNNLGKFTQDASSETEILEFTFPGLTISTEIFKEKDSIACEVVYSAQLDSLFPVFTLSEGAQSIPASADSMDFSDLADPILVTAEDGITKAEWVVTVKKAAQPSSEKEILDLYFTEQRAEPVINKDKKIIVVSLAYGTELDKLKPVFKLSPGAKLDPAIGEIVDFSADTTLIKVIAEDKTEQEWKVVTHYQIEEVSNLAEFRTKLGSKSTIRVTGEIILTGQMSYRNQKYLQDATAGILIDDPKGVIKTSYNTGDGITGIVGTITEHNGVVQLVPVEDPGAASSSQNSFAPKVVTISELKSSLSNYESQLIKIEGIKFKDAGGKFENGKNYTIYFGSETTVCRTQFYDTDLIGTEIPDSVHITGIAGNYKGSAQICPRELSDIEEISGELSTDATLSDLKVDGVTITGFSSDKESYKVVLPAATTKIPAVTATSTDVNAKVDVKAAENLAGTAAERTTTVTVTAEDGKTTKAYKVEFEVKTSSLPSFTLSEVKIYPSVVNDYLFIENASSVDNIQIVNLTGVTVLSRSEKGEEKISMDMSKIQTGVYILKLTAGKETQVKRFIKR